MKLIDLTGQKFGRLTVLYRLHNYHKHGTYWLCLCDCGNLTEVTRCNLRSSHTKSCGCYQLDRAVENGTKHGKSDTRLYSVWQGMKDRCYNKNIIAYEDYGARGIKICNEWLDDFMNFYDWAMDNNYKENLSIDRIDNDKGYSPANCRWATKKQQARNTRRNRNITINDETHCLSEWCEILNINYGTVCQRLYRDHWSVKKALEVDNDKYNDNC